MIELLAPGFLYSLAKDGLQAVMSRKRRLSPTEIVERRQKWKPLFEEEVTRNYQGKLRSDVIVRDMKRIDSYPDVKEQTAISPWFRVGLVDTYHRGILLGLRWGTLTQQNGERWRYTNYNDKEEGDIKVILIGRVLYENIETVDWEGDEYYSCPHIYCYFTHKNEPYEHLGFYTETTTPSRPPFYTEVASYKQVRRLSQKLGVKHFS